MPGKSQPLHDIFAYDRVNDIARGYIAGQDAIGIRLEKGRNTCLMKITQGRGGWEASASITDEHDVPIRGLTWKNE